MGSFSPNHIKFELKSTEELSLMTLKSDAKFKEKLTGGFKYEIRNLVNLLTKVEYILSILQIYFKYTSSILHIYFTLFN